MNNGDSHRSGTKQTTRQQWRSPQAGMIKINTGGTADLRTMDATGGLLRDDTGQWLTGFHRNIDSCLAFQTELWASFYGLTSSSNHGFKDVEAKLDNKEWRAKLSYVRRESNEVADALAHIECNGRLGLMVLSHPSNEIWRALNLDSSFFNLGFLTVLAVLYCYQKKGYGWVTLFINCNK
ncbi:hypothetical protein F3Y22_tig00110733pilonHSYRG00352 [Hibiscus syriacus]|uniref:RNase H type-1 domain-containing protein n=1 Tax=Hibiscus syriacus TaxID=106335 RepID=A0A6A2ZSZ3_HIBSY|nr:hypothetical protein F3Y22_tig00110733pilonHSYRG00352 [Hibiscus syriacus]